jgi:hypothetical protein
LCVGREGFGTDIVVGAGATGGAKDAGGCWGDEIARLLLVGLGVRGL